MWVGLLIRVKEVGTRFAEAEPVFPAGVEGFGEFFLDQLECAADMAGGVAEGVADFFNGPVGDMPEGEHGDLFPAFGSDVGIGIIDGFPEILRFEPCQNCFESFLVAYTHVLGALV